MVPKGWKKTHLKCVISGAIKNGYSPLPASTTTGYWVLSLGALTDHGINPLEIKPVVVDEKVKQALLSDGDFLVSRSNTPDKVGRSIRFRNEVQNCSYPDLMMRFCVDTTKADPNFIEIKLKSTEVRQYYKSCAAGSSSSMVKINKAVVENTPLLLPPFPEQRKIAKILSTWDSAICVTEQLLANSQQQKKALMQQLLTGKKRLLDNNGVRFSGEWKTYKFGSLFNERVETGRDDLPLLSITADDGVIYQEDTGRKNTSNEDKSKYRRICVNDIGYNTMRMWQGRSSLSDKEGIVSPAYTIVTPTSKVCPAYAAYLFKFPALVHIFYRHSQGLVSDTWNLKFNHFKKISWQVPSIDEQQKIAAVLSTADKEITALQQKLAALKQEKKALMQQLLTGKRRVKVEVAA